jgi:hypothetical protein
MATTKIKPYPKRKTLDIILIKDGDNYKQGNPDGDYNEVIECIDWALNDSYGNGANVLRKCVTTLNDKFGIQISTKFLTNLMRDKKDARSRIAYLLKKADIKTRRAIRYYTAQGGHKRNTTKVEWKKLKFFKIVETPTYTYKGKVLDDKEIVLNALEGITAKDYEVIGKFYKAEGLLKVETPIRVGSFSAYERKKEVLRMLVLKGTSE